VGACPAARLLTRSESTIHRWWVRSRTVRSRTHAESTHAVIAAASDSCDASAPPATERLGQRETVHVGERTHAPSPCDAGRITGTWASDARPTVPNAAAFGLLRLSGRVER
jgi:hypothetical protein